MLVPAIYYKEELKKKFDLLRYSDKAVWFNGCIENGGIQIQEEPSDGKFQYAIVEHKPIQHYAGNPRIPYSIIGYEDVVVGYLGFYIGWYDRGVWGIGLISFEDKPNPAVMSAVREAMRMFKEYDLHRIEFRAIEGNPAVERYDKIAKKFASKNPYSFTRLKMTDTFRDRRGYFRDSYIYEFLKIEPRQKEIKG